VDPASLFKANLARARFAETVTYQPADGGSSRPVVCIVDASEHLASIDTNELEQEEIDVTFARDESDANVGGVNVALVGDTLLRAGDTRKYSYRGQKIEESGYHLRLKFGRDRARQIGAVHNQRR